MKKRIMIIDDDPRISEVYKTALEMQDYEVVAKVDAEKAMDAIIKDGDKPDLILLDIMMPKISGLELLDIIKTKSKIKNTKVIMLSALSDETIKKKAMDQGAYSYMVKSELSMSEVIEKIRDALNS